MHQKIKAILEPLKEKFQFTPKGYQSEQINKHFVSTFKDMANLRAWLPYRSFDDDNHILINKASRGFLLEVAPITGATEQTCEILASLFTDLLPEGTDIQFLLIGSHHIGAQLQRFVQARQGGEAIFQWLAQKRATWLSQGTLKPLFPNQNLILRNFQLILSVSLPEKHPDCTHHKLAQIRSRILTTLNSIQLQASPLPIDAFINLITQLTSPCSKITDNPCYWDSLNELANQMTNPAYEWLCYPDHLSCSNGSREAWDIICLQAGQYPKHWAQWQMADSIGHLFNSALQIPCPFLISFNIHINPRQGVERLALKAIDKEKDMRSTKAKLMPHLYREYQDHEFLRTRLSEGDRAVDSLYQIILYCPQGQSVDAERAVNDLYRSLGWKLTKTRYLQWVSWLSTLPMTFSEGLYDDFKRLKLLRTITGFNAANLAPIQGEFKGTSTPRMLFAGRRGQIASFDVFDQQEGNFNIAIAAKSGSGKSTLTQEIIVSLLGTGGQVWVIDAGRSYEKTCELIGGKFLCFDPSHPLCINPFTHISDFENEALPLLKPLFAAMVHPQGSASDEELSYLEQALKGAWEAKGNDASVSEVVAWLKAQQNPTCKQLITLLYSYTKAGMYGQYFEGQANINLNAPFVVLELQELKNKKDLQRVVLLVMMYHISQTMVKADRAKPKMCIVDEAWDLLNLDGAKEFIELLARTARKFKLSLVTITQSIADYYRSRAAQAAFENSDHKIILAQTPETISQVKKQQYLTIDDFTEKAFKSLRKTNDYAECVIQSPGHFSIQRIILDPFSRILYSSTGEEVKAVKALQAQGLSLKEAIEIMVKNKHDKSVI